MRFANVDDALLPDHEPYDPATGIADRRVRSSRPSTNRASPTSSPRWRWCSTTRCSDTSDRSTGGATGSRSPRTWAAGASPRSRSTTAATTASSGPIVLATRLLYFGRIGPDAVEFRIFAGSTELIRGTPRARTAATSASTPTTSGTETGCAELDRLIGTQLGGGERSSCGSRS